MDPRYPGRPGKTSAPGSLATGPDGPAIDGAPSRGVLNELARGFLLGVQSQDPEVAARFASQFLKDQTRQPPDGPPIRPRTVRGPLPRAAPDGRTLEPPPPR